MLVAAVGAGAGLVLAAPPAYAADSPVTDCDRWFEQHRSDPSGTDTTQHATITGVVRSGIFGTVLPGARVDVTELGATVCSDSAGTYRLDGLGTGAVTVRVTRPGYDTLALVVTVPARGALRVDITLSPKIVVLDSVHVSASRPAARAMPFHTGQDDGDAWIWTGDPGASVASTGEPDLLRALSADPHLSFRPDWPGSLSDRGSGSDQLLVRVDGLPVWSPVHGGGTLSVISPDAVGSFTVHDGAMPATFGDRLGGVVDVETLDAPPLGWTGSASLGPAAIRATWARPLTVGDATGGMRIAFRHSNDDLAGLANDAGLARDRWADGVATVGMATQTTALRFVVVASGDRAALGGNSFVTDAPSPNAIPWSTATAGVVWTQSLGADTRLDSHVSTARFDASIPAAADSSGRSLGDGVRQTELATQLSWRAMAFGATLDALNVSYRAGQAAAASPGATLNPEELTGDPRRPPLALVGAPILASAFAERHWGPADSAWHVTTGVRGMALLGTTARLEPRLDASLRVLPGVIATIGYGRTHQAVQSLRNAESPLGVALGIDLPVAAGTGGVPLAQSDVGTAGVITQLGAVGRLSVDGYVRALSGLAVADPLRSSLFAGSGFARASARVTGLAAQLDGARGPFTWQTGYGVGRTVESAAGLSYYPTSELGQTGSAALGFAVDRLTQLRLAGWAAFGQRAPGLDGMAVGHDDDGSSPSTTGLVDHTLTTAWAATTRLPSYLRADLQLAHQWQTGPASGRLSTYLTVANLFNHANIATQVPTGTGGSLRGLTLLPRTVLVGVSWAY